MRMLLHVTFPLEPFNTYVKDGTAGAKMKRILDEMKPEAAYFMDSNGQRSGMLFFHMDHTSQIPTYAEPWFLTFNAKCHFKPVMNPEDLGKAGLEALGKKWA